ncbi:phage tail tape measure protein [Serratia rubidaea]|uniref:phage tail tape measure protein n=1 Tax=Serratia rubidaea TaxID=61652 RepID=UPI001F23D303|nr:phage tail tape measure protein [Serratia rubidaea]UJD79810.1 phage tail tape measure protein [Serratia rubidaea]UJD84366.1 phage tail tape measure protein [Serratia rubidaea]
MDLSIRVAFSAIDKLTRPVKAAGKAVGGLSESLKRTQNAVKDLDRHATSFDKLRSQANDTAQKLSKAQRAFDGLNQKMREGGQLSENQAARLEALRGKISRLTQTYGQQTTKLRETAQALRQHGVNLNAGSGAVQSAIRRTEQYNQQLERERRQLAAVTQAQSRYARTKDMAGKMRGAGVGMMAGGAAAGYAGGRFLAPAVGFDAEMSRVQALTRLDKDSGELANLRAQAKKLGAETAFTSSDAASGQAFLAMAGFTPQAVQAALPGVLNMALAGGMELGESSDIGSNILSQFTLPAEEMDRVSDVLTAAFTRSNTDLRNLGDTMKYAGPVASKLGISLEVAAGMAGILANNGLRGSDAGTAMRASLARLSSPPKAAAKALQELGVSVADATGKMRPAETILLDLYNATKKYGQVDQVSFFKDIAGEEAFVGLQTLVAGAGSGELQKLIGELKGANGEASKVAKTMADNLGGDLKNLDSAWEGFRIQVEETADGSLRKLTQGLSDTITVTSSWVKENPKLAQSLLLAAGVLTALVAGLGAVSLAVGLLAGPFAKIRLGFSLLASALPAIGGALSALLTPVGLIVAAFVGAGLLIWRYWEPIKAFFIGFGAGVMEALAPLREAFSRLSPIFGVIGDALGRVWEWFKKLLSPMQASKETLDKCASAGETFGRVFGSALQVLLYPLTKLMDGVGWLLEKMGLIPDGIEQARRKAESLRNQPAMWEWDPQQKKMVKKGWSWAGPGLPTGAATVNPNLGGPPPPILTGDTGTQRRLGQIADNTKTTADNTKAAAKRIGPGDIVFKNLPRALALRGAYQEARVMSQPASRIATSPGGVLSVPSATPAATAAPVSAPGGGPVVQVIFNDVGKRTDLELERMVRNALRDAMASTARYNRGSFRDRD